MNRSVIAWIAFDFVNSVLIINGAIYYSLWLVGEQKASPLLYNATFAASTLLLFVVSPLFGARIDKHQSARPLLLWTSFLMGILTMLMPAAASSPTRALRIAGTLILFGMINFCYQLCLVPYQWSLRLVAPDHQWRKLIGFSEAASHFGSVAGAAAGPLFAQLPLVRRFYSDHPDQTLGVLASVGMVYLLFLAIVLILLRPALRGSNAVAIVRPRFWRSFGLRWAEYKATIKLSFQTLREVKRFKIFLAAWVLYSDALLTVQLNLPVFLHERLKLSESGIRWAYAASLLCSALGGLIYSRKLTTVKCKWVVGLTVVVWILVFQVLSSFSVYVLWLWGAVIVGGFAFGILWCGSRSLVYELVPPDHLGRAFGLFTVFGRSASVFGPLIWGLILLNSQSVAEGYLFAFFAMNVILGASLFLLTLL